MSAIPCAHCQNKMIELVNTVEKHSEGELDGGDKVYVSWKWQIWLCSNCDKETITRQFFFSEDIITLQDAEGNFYQADPPIEVIYPPEGRKFLHLPSAVHRAYDTALKVFSVEPTAFAIMANRTLEIMCVEREAKGNDLEKKLNDLKDRNILPQTLNDMAQSLRLLRNAGVHNVSPPVYFSEQDAKTLRYLCEAVLEYVYEAPAMVGRVKVQIDEVKSLKEKK